MLRVTSKGNTCFVVSDKHTRIILDPALDFFRKKWNRASMVTPDPSFLRDVAAIFISHSHTDHFHLPSLWFVDRSVPVYLPAADRDAKWPMVAQLRDFGFKRIYHIDEWKNVSVSGLIVTAVPAPDSIEGIPQTSFLIKSGRRTLLHGADSLEDISVFRQLRSYGPLDAVALPVNCGFMFDNVRNQMSPTQAMNAVRILEPSLFIPTGLEGGRSSDVSGIQYSPFPHNNVDAVLQVLRKHRPNGTEVALLPQGAVLELSTENGEIMSYGDETSEMEAPQCLYHDRLGQALCLLISNGRQDQDFFGVPSLMPYEQWRSKWVALVDDNANDLLDEVHKVLPTLPIKHLGLPLVRYFPRSLAYLDTYHPEKLLALLCASLELVPQCDEKTFVEKVAVFFVGLDVILDQLVSLEHRIHKQVVFLHCLPAYPRGIREMQARDLARHQLARDLDVPDLAYPRVNDLFAPITLNLKVLASFGVSPPKSGGPSIVVVPIVRVDENGISSTLHPIDGGGLLLVQVLIHSRGKNSVEEICAALGWSVESFRERSLTIVEWAPHMLEFHWVPGT